MNCTFNDSFENKIKNIIKTKKFEKISFYNKFFLKNKCFGPDIFTCTKKSLGKWHIVVKIKLA